MKVLIFGYGKESTAATSNILLNISKLLCKKSDVEIILFGCAEKAERKNIDKNISIITMKSMFSSQHFSIHRVIRKIKTILKKDCLCLGWRKVFHKALSLFKNDKFDFVIGASGPFMYTQAAYKYALRKGTKFGIIYFDPFTDNISSRNKNKRSKLEKQWYEKASFIMEENSANHIPFEDYKNISIKFDIPIFEKPFKYSKDGPIVYGGAFYESFRPTSLLVNFIKNNLSENEAFHIFSNQKDAFSNISNVYSSEMVDQSSFDEECLRAKAIIVVGNGNDCKTIPSKIMYALSFRKPLIGFNLGNYPINYPYYYSCDEKNIFDKINNISEDQLRDINLYFYYPERNPDLMAKKLEKALLINDKD